MSLVFEIFKRVQLFFFAFTLAASTMMYIGIGLGKIDRFELYGDIADKLAVVAMENPALREKALALYARAQGGRNISTVPPQDAALPDSEAGAGEQFQRRNNGLDALKNRQKILHHISTQTHP